MPKHGPEDSEMGPGKMNEEEIIRLARNYAEMHYSHENDIDFDAVREDITQRIPLQAPPPFSRPQQAWASISYAWQRVPWSLRAMVKRPYALALIFTAMAITAAIVIFVALKLPLIVPGTQTARNSSASARPSDMFTAEPIATGQAAQPHLYSGAKVTGSADGHQSPAPAPTPVGKPANRNLLKIDITIGGKNGSLVSLNVTLRYTGIGGTELKANLGLAVDPATSVCSLSRLANGGPNIPQLLATLKAPIWLEVGPSHPLVVRLLPTGTPAQPLACSILKPGVQSGPSTAIGKSASRSGTLGTILRSANSILGL